MKKILVKFKDEELGTELVTFKYNEKKYDYTETMNLAKDILYLDFSDYSYKELKEKFCSELTRRLYNIAIKVLDYGNYGVTTERFCEFMEMAFGWKSETMIADSVFDVENGEWDYE